MAKLVSKTYGEALFELAMEESTGEHDRAMELMEEILQLQKALADNPDFDKLMKHPGVPKQDKVSLMENVFKGRMSNEIIGLLEMVIQKERYRDLPAIFQYYIDRVKEERRIGVAYVTTAVTLSEMQKKAVEKRLLETTSYRRMEMNFQTDVSLIGGMTIRINDRVVDSSIRTKLNDLTKQLLQIQLG